MPEPSEPTEKERRLTGAVYIAVGAVAVVGVALIGAAIAGAAGWSPVEPLVTAPSAANVATFTVAGATLLLADFTALLAWFTWESIGATRREARIAEASLEAVQQQAKIAQSQVDATNRQAEVAQDQLAASWRPLIRELSPLTAPSIEIRPRTDEDFGFQVRFANIGRGPAFVRKAFLWLVSAGVRDVSRIPEIVEPEGTVLVTFKVSPLSSAVDRSLADALIQGHDLTVALSYHDIGRSAAWQSRVQLVKQSGSFDWTLTGTTVSEVPVRDLD